MCVLLRMFFLQDFSCVLNAYSFFLGFFLPVIILCAKINWEKPDARKFIFGQVCMFLKKYIQQREADVHLPLCSTSTITSKVWIGCGSKKLLELKDADSSRGLVTPPDRAIWRTHICKCVFKFQSRSSHCKQEIPVVHLAPLSSPAAVFLITKSEEEAFVLVHLFLCQVISREAEWVMPLETLMFVIVFIFIQAYPCLILCNLLHFRRQSLLIV